MLPKISIIIPTYNDTTYLSKAINSVLKQKYPRNKYEIIIVDGSTNDNIYRLYKVKYSKYKTVRYVRKRGCNLPEALNIGIKNMLGTFFKQLDSDDLLMRGSLRTYDYYATKNPNFLIFYSDAYIIDKKGRIINKKEERTFKTVEELAKALWKGSIGYPSSYLINKNAFDLVGTFNPKNKQAEDWEWRIKAAFINKLRFYHIKKPLIAYRVHENQKSTLEQRTNSIYLYKMKKRLASEIKEKTKDRSFEQILKVSLIKAAVSFVKKNIEITLKLNRNRIYRKYISKIEEKFGNV